MSSIVKAKSFQIDEIIDFDGNGSPNFPNGLKVSGVPISDFGGGGEEINYLLTGKNGDTVDDINAWVPYTSNTLESNPVPPFTYTSSLAISRNTVNPLSGNGDIRITKPGSNIRGQGRYLPFSIENRHLAKKLQITFDVRLESGTYEAGDLRISIIQDPEGTPVVIEPVNTEIETGIAGLTTKVIATFQTHIEIKDYALAIHVATATIEPFVIDFNNFRVWEQDKNYGAIITEWQSYTPTIQGNSGGNLTSFMWRRNGGNLEIMGRGQLGTTSASEFRLSLPNGLTVSSQIVTANTQVGILNTNDSQSSTFKQWILLATSDNSYFNMSHGGDGFNTTIPTLAPQTTQNITSSSSFTLQASVPIQGWGSSMTLSSESGDGREVACRYTGFVSQSYTGGVTNFQWATPVFDTHNAVTTGTDWRFTSPVTGYYRVSIDYLFQITDSTGTAISIYKGTGASVASEFSRLMDVNNAFGQSGTMTIRLNKGDFIQIRAVNTKVYASSVNAGFSIEKISASSQIMARDEVVACRYLTDTPQNNTIIKFEDKDFDTHNSYDIVTGKYTIPVSGIYQLGIQLQTVNPSSYLYIYCRKNNDITIATNLNESGSGYYANTFSFVTNFIRGETVYVYYSAGNNTLTTQSSNYFSIYRIG
jgi:hypothetical protein